MTAKKSFSHANPAMSFITSPIIDNEQEVEAQDSSSSDEKSAVILQEKTHFDVPMKRNPEFIEVKSKRMQLLMQPSLHIAIKQLADEEGISVNEKIHSILKDYVEKRDLDKVK